MRDLTKWTDEDLEYEICTRLRDWLTYKDVTDCEGYSKFRAEIDIFVEEFNRRHPYEEEWDENGNYKGN